jgi:hypothetical protein
MDGQELSTYRREPAWTQLLKRSRLDPDRGVRVKTDFRKELENLINKYSKENGSDTPDFILADYLADCLAAFDRAVRARTDFYRPDDPSAGSGLDPDRGSG